MIRTLFKICFLVTVLATFSVHTVLAAPKATSAQTQVQVKKNKAKKDIAQIKKKMTARKKVAAKLAKKEKKTKQELVNMRYKLINATQELQNKQTEQHDLESRLSELEKETSQRGHVLKESRRRLAKMTSSLLQLSRKPPGMLLLHEQSADAHVHRTILLQSMLPRLKQETAAIMKEIDNFRELQSQTASQKRIVGAARQNLQWQRHNLDQLVKVRQGLLKKTKAEKQVIARQLERLTNEAKDLRQLMAKVSNPKWRRKVVGKDIKIKNLRSGLKMPVAGKMVRRFGAKDEFGVVSDGLVLAGAYGAPVVAPQSGRVVFKGPFRGYGKIVILQHPGGYHSFLSGFARIDANMGQRVDAGEPLGILPIQGEGKPHIYFEWRKGTEPVNPIKKS